MASCCASPCRSSTRSAARSSPSWRTKYAEAARVAVRNVRRDGMDLLKRLEKDHKIGQDEQHTKADELQKLTDAHIKDIDASLHSKEQEIMQV